MLAGVRVGGFGCVGVVLVLVVVLMVVVSNKW